MARRKTFRRRAIRYGLIGGNIILLAAVISFIVASAGSNQAVSSLSLGSSSASASTTDPLDTLSAADIAETVAGLANLPEATAVRNQADSVNAELAITPAESVVVAKPQIVNTALKSRQDIIIYTSKPGDTVSKLAAQFNVTSDSIKWSNALLGNIISPGTKLYIPPINGIVYLVRPGDTSSSIAQKYGVSVQEIIAYNDAEIGGLHDGEHILIPNGQLQQQSTGAPSIFTSLSSNFTATYGNNGYDYGFCTWYVASQIPVPSNWGNAATWAYYAGLSGWNVSSVPTVGAIAQTAYAAGGEGHVAIVTAVKGNMIEFKDMNDPYWGVVTQHGWTSASLYQNYITR